MKWSHILYIRQIIWQFWHVYFRAELWILLDAYINIFNWFHVYIFVCHVWLLIWFNIVSKLIKQMRTQSNMNVFDCVLLGLPVHFLKVIPLRFQLHIYKYKYIYVYIYNRIQANRVNKINTLTLTNLVPAEISFISVWFSYFIYILHIHILVNIYLYILCCILFEITFQNMFLRIH